MMPLMLWVLLEISLHLKARGERGTGPGLREEPGWRDAGTKPPVPTCTGRPVPPVPIVTPEHRVCSGYLPQTPSVFRFTRSECILCDFAALWF